ncbi:MULTISPECIES: hypothetical protein [Psychrilyobacter]|uniref:Uncharacterized protein n=1 Tax=Psychrilyobacter piezotolerans TaxID=2293438 RepID=A0ABX9KJE1_9FUSO|nr:MULTISPECIES: hypothetical protein [Psychrilyobacter]MCS5421234.1 hypothetical protein [Psychrilyobacter sp. S5]NDI77009.1 hypothetical protein [Psychrilyobacter piezotolerans]RDE64626.1 hypothetical protein DV867_03535 [Psychrilyobacter sp. S5]REI42438.1 hypothetical protein DYH56_03535 [Psychrilyobacter piezotolerans]
MRQSEIEERFEALQFSLGGDELRSIQYAIKQARENGTPIEKVREKYRSSIPLLDKLYEKASAELKWLYQKFSGSPNHNLNTGKVFSLMEQIKHVKNIIIGENTNK